MPVFLDPGSWQPENLVFKKRTWSVAPVAAAGPFLIWLLKKGGICVTERQGRVTGKFKS